MTAFVFSLVLLLGIILFWAFRKLWEGAVISFDPRVPVYRTGSVAAAQPSPPRPSPTSPPPSPTIESSSPSAGDASTAAVGGPAAPSAASNGAGPAAGISTPAPATSASSSIAAQGSGAVPAATDANGAAPTGSPTAPVVGAPAPAGARDNLRRMIGIGPVNERHLNGLGITTFAQIAGWTAEDVRRVEAVLAFDGRIARERWVEQAGLLANGDTDEFLRRFPQAGRGGNT